MGRGRAAYLQIWWWISDDFCPDVSPIKCTAHGAHVPTKLPCDSTQLKRAAGMRRTRREASGADASTAAKQSCGADSDERKREREMRGRRRSDYAREAQEASLLLLPTRVCCRRVGEGVLSSRRKQAPLPEILPRGRKEKTVEGRRVSKGA